MPNLLSLIKQAAVEAVTEAGPCAVLFGTVENPNPLEIKVDDRFLLKEAQLACAETAAGLEKEDAVLLLRMQGGNKYIILGRML